MKRSQLPQVTELDRRLRPDDIRTTPNGGFAWRCHYCRRYACDQSLQGRFLCRCHGGSTPRQRDLVQQYLHHLETGKCLRPPGRPLISGLSSRTRKVHVDELKAEADRTSKVLRVQIVRELARVEGAAKQWE